MRVNRKFFLGGVGSLLLLACVIVIILVVYYNTENKDSRNNSILEKCIQKVSSPSTLARYTKAGVSTNGQKCAQIGSDILNKNGSAVDAAIAALLCEGVASLHSMGLGGGFLMTIWDAKEKKADFLDARETAPGKSSPDMFHGNSTSSQFGGMAVAVPGELMGYWEAHQKYGKLNWSELFQPTIELCERGSIINDYLAGYLESKESFIKAESTLAEILIDPNTNRVWKKGDRIKRPKLRKTLQLIANQGPGIFYNGSMGEDIVEEIQKFNGIITMEDLRDYKVKWKSPIETRVDNLTMYTAPPPGSGIILSFIMKTLENMIDVKDPHIMWQRITEAFKWGYARRTELGDPDFVDIRGIISNLTSEDYIRTIKMMIKDNVTSNNPKHYGAITATTTDSGTAHVSVLAPDGSAVSVTSTINQVFGAMIRSNSTGIIFNDEMDDFSAPNITNAFDLPASPANFIKPGKRPLSSMCPTIMVDESKNVRLVIGAAGGTKITTGVALATIFHIWADYNVKEAVDAKRLHHQLFPMTIQYENGFCPKILDDLHNIGHNVTRFTGIGSAVTVVAKEGESITANSDYRREGRTAGF